MGWPGPPTARQVAVWRAWLADEWDRPSRTDWYLMALRATWEKYIMLKAGIDDPERLPDAAAMRLAFTTAAPPPVSGDAAQDQEARREYETSLSKAAALRRLGDRAARLVEAPLPPAGEEPVVEEQPDWTWRG